MHTRHDFRHRLAVSGRVQACLVSVLVAVAVAACSSSGGSSSAGNTASGGAQAASCDIGPAQAAVAAGMKEPTFTPPGPAFDATKAAGKSVVSIPQLINPFNEGNENAMAAVSKLVGVKFKQFVNNGTVTQYVQGFDQALANGANGIDLFGADARQLQPQISAAHAKGVVVTALQTYDNTQVASVLPTLHVDAMTTWPYEETGKLFADWIIADSHCHADVSMIYDPGDVPATAVLVGAMKAEFAKLCPQCKLSSNLVSVFDWSTKLQSTVQSAIVKDPNINYMVPIYDAMTQWVDPAIIAAGKATQIKVVSCSGTPSALTLIKNGGPLAMDIGTSATWEGYAVMDNMLRLLTGNKPLAAQNYPIRIFTKANVNLALPNPDAAFGTSFVAGYKKLWELSS